MENLKGKFTRIKGSFSEVRRLPRLGKIRLGVKVEKVGRNGNVSFPRETEYFVCPPEVQEIYGEKPTELDVMLPADDPELIFQQKLAMYGSGAGLKCHGNGQEAERLDEKTKKWEARSCPCEFLRTEQNLKGACTEQSHLMVLLPKVSMGGCYQITTRSFHSTVALNSALDYIRGLAGRIALLPLKLRRVPQVTHHDGKAQTHYTLSLVLDVTLNQIADMRTNPAALVIPAQYQIEGPRDENPEADPPDVQEVDAAELADMEEDEIDQLQQQLDEKLKANGNGAPKDATKDATKDAPPAQPPTKPAESAAAPPGGSGGSQPPAPKGRPESITDVQWISITAYFDSTPELRAVKDAVKKTMGVPHMNLNGAGRLKFREEARAEAARRGVSLDVPK